MIEAIILAAGESRRMGQLKPLLKIGDQTFLCRIVNELKRAGINNIYIVVGHEANRIIKESDVPAFFIRNEQYQNGQFSSLQKGIAALSPECCGVLVCLADQPQITSTWIEKLVAAFDPAGKIVRPTFNGRSGHPILYSKALFKEILALPPTASAKELMNKYADSTKYVEMDSAAILFDADTPEDLESIKKFL